MSNSIIEGRPCSISLWVMASMFFTPIRKTSVSQALARPDQYVLLSSFEAALASRDDREGRACARWVGGCGRRQYYGRADARYHLEEYTFLFL